MATEQDFYDYVVALCSSTGAIAPGTVRRISIFPQASGEAAFQVHTAEEKHPAVGVVPLGKDKRRRS